MSEMDAFLKEFGKTLKVARKQMGLSQVSAAQSMHIDYRHYQNIEGGKINLRLDTLIKLVKFYSLDRAGRPFNLESCLDILSGHSSGSSKNVWRTLYHHFVECGQAGFLTFDPTQRMVGAANEMLVKNLGLNNEQELKGKAISDLFTPESVAQIAERIERPLSEHLLNPLVVTFKNSRSTMMMAVVNGQAENSAQAQMILFDRRTLAEEGDRLKDVVDGYTQFMKLNPQLKAV